MYETLQSIVDQLEYCDYQTKDDLHELKMNAAFIALKERAAADTKEQNGHIAQHRKGKIIAVDCLDRTVIVELYAGCSGFIIGSDAAITSPVA